MDNQFPHMAEALRRRMGGQPSGAGVPGQTGAQPSSMGNPIEQQGFNRMSDVQSTATDQNPMAGATSALDGAKIEQSSMILKSLIKALDRLTGGQ